MLPFRRPNALGYGVFWSGLQSIEQQALLAGLGWRKIVGHRFGLSRCRYVLPVCQQFASNPKLLCSVLTGALGDITTLGASGWPCLPGVDGPPGKPWPPLAEGPPRGGNRPWLVAFEGGWPGIGAPGCDCVAASNGGLPRESTRLLVDDDGVAAGDWPEELAPCGEAVPDEESFFLASLLPSRSLARES